MSAHRHREGCRPPRGDPRHLHAALGKPLQARTNEGDVLRDRYEWEQGDRDVRRHGQTLGIDAEAGRPPAAQQLLQRLNTNISVAVRNRTQNRQSPFCLRDATPSTSPKPDARANSCVTFAATHECGQEKRPRNLDFDLLGRPATSRPRRSPPRATRSKSEPPSDAEIERGLRERAVSDPRAAEILLRWLQRPRAEERVGGVDLESMSERELERLYSGLVRLASLEEPALAALLEQVLAGDELASSV